MTDSDLLMLENLTYFETKHLNEAGVTKTLEQCSSVKEFLNQFDDNALAKLDAGNVKELEKHLKELEAVRKFSQDKSKYDKEIQRIKGEIDRITDNQEWAAKIRYMQNNSEIRNLKIKEYNPEVKCLLFEDPKDSNHAIVAFRGTSGACEWKDNVEGLNRADTEAQLNAKAYIDSLGYESVTVTGHSKGGNKAMYVAITCDKVDRCVAYDAQGFSSYFIDKYSVDIQNRASKIKNYSLKNDYVHVLMFPIPGAEQIYMEPGNRVNKVGGPHYPIGPFRLKQVNGKWYIDTEDGAIHIAAGEDSSMSILHDFSTYLMNNMSSEELDGIVELLGPILMGVFDKESGFNIGDYAKSHRQEIAKLIAYLLKYLKDNNMDLDDLIGICESIGLSEDELYEVLGEMMGQAPWKVELFLSHVFSNITDGKDDPIIRKLLGDTMYYMWWETVEREYCKIKTKNDTSDYTSAIRDYSGKVYDSIMAAIESFERIDLPKASAWGEYSTENWFSRFSVDVAIKCINGYVDQLSELNVECKARVNTTFDNIKAVDNKYSEKFTSDISDIKTLVFRIQS